MYNTVILFLHTNVFEHFKLIKAYFQWNHVVLMCDGRTLT